MYWVVSEGGVKHGVEDGSTFVMKQNNETECKEGGGKHIHFGNGNNPWHPTYGRMLMTLLLLALQILKP